MKSLILSVILLVSSAFAFSSKSSITPPYCVNLQCKVDPKRRDEFLSLIQENQRLTLQNEPEALQYTVGEDVDNLNTFYFHEQFTSLQGFAAHRATPHNAVWQEFRKTNPFLQDPVIHFYHGTHDPVKAPLPSQYENIFCLNVQLCIDSAVRDEFLEVIANNARGSNEEEPQCLQYVWGEDATEANTFHFHEQYVGKAGFEAHAATDHFAEWEAFADRDPFTKPPVVSFYQTL